MKPFIRITRYPYEEPHHVCLVVEASNGQQLGKIEIYANAVDIKNLAADLRGFPKESQQIVIWELGSENPEDRFAFYYRLRVFQVDVTGRCAIELRFNNNQNAPDREVIEFSIETYPADLDRLSDLLKKFSRLHHRVLEWNVIDGQLLKDVSECDTDYSP